MGKKRVGKQPGIRVEVKPPEGSNSAAGSQNNQTAQPTKSQNQTLVRTSSMEMETIIMDGEMDTAFDKQLYKVNDEVEGNIQM